MADKPMVASVTIWGVICTQIPQLMEAVGAFLQHKTPLPDFLEVVAVPIGIIISAIGARRVVGKALSKEG